MMVMVVGMGRGGGVMRRAVMFPRGRSPHVSKGVVVGHSCHSAHEELLESFGVLREMRHPLWVKRI